MKLFTLQSFWILIPLLAFVAMAVPESRCEENGLTERQKTYRKQAAESRDPVAVWIAIAENDHTDEVRLAAIHALRKYADDPRLIPFLERLAVKPPRQKGERESPMYPTDAKRLLHQILGDKEWREIETKYPDKTARVTPAKKAFQKTTNPFLQEYIRKFLIAQGDHDSLVFLIDEDKDVMKEELCSAIASRITNGDEKLYKICLGYLQACVGKVEGPFEKRWAVGRKGWIAATVMMHLKRPDALDDLLAVIAVDNSLFSSDLSSRVPEAIAACKDDALPKLREYLQKKHSFKSTSAAVKTVTRIGGPDAIQILDIERVKYLPGSEERREIDYYANKAKNDYAEKTKNK